MTLSKAQVQKLQKYYSDQVISPCNVSGMKDNWSWIGQGDDPLDYLLTLDNSKDQAEDGEDVRSQISITGIIVRTEEDRYKMLIHLGGCDSHLNDPAFWDQQYNAMVRMAESFPIMGDEKFELVRTQETLVFKVKLLQSKTPLVVVDSKETVIEGNPAKLIKPGDLVVIDFVPYAWRSDGKTGMACVAKKIKIVKEGHVSPAALVSAKRKSQSFLSNASPKKPKTIIAVPLGVPSTANLGF